MSVVVAWIATISALALVAAVLLACSDAFGRSTSQTRNRRSYFLRLPLVSS